MPNLRYPTADELEARLRAIAARRPDICDVLTFTRRSQEGKLIPYIRIRRQNAAPNSLISVVITGGYHAREWAPPEALIDFAEVLLGRVGPSPDFRGTPATYPPFRKRQMTGNPNDPFRRRIDPAGGVVNFQSFVIPADTVGRIISKLEINIVPLVNVDGRIYSQTRRNPAAAEQTWWWRKSRRPKAAGDPACIDIFGLDEGVGVDLNRNFDFGWAIDEYYEPRFLAEQLGRRADGLDSKISISKDACGPTAGRLPVEIRRALGQTYRGVGSVDAAGHEHPTLEPETQNVVDLMRDSKARFYLDVHSSAHAVYYGWGTADTGNDPKQSFLNRVEWDRKRVVGPGYKEFMPDARQGRFKALAEYMSEYIFRRAVPARRVVGGAMPLLDDRAYAPNYPAKSPVDDYAAPGSATDYFTSLQFTSGPGNVPIVVDPIRYGLTLECGSSAEGHFWPDRDNEFPKISREVALALWAYLNHAAGPYGDDVKWPIAPAIP